MRILMYGGRRWNKNQEPKYLWQFLQKYFSKKNKLEGLNSKSPLKIISKVKDFNPKIIVCISIISSLVITLRKFIPIKKPVIHIWNDDYHKCGGFGGKFLRKVVEHWIVKNSDLNITCSKFREKTANKLNAKVKYIPHGVIEDFDKIKPSKKLRGKIKVVYGGEISKRKSIDKIVETAKQNPEAKFYIFGGNIKPDMKKSLEEKPENFYLMGKVPHKKLISYYKAADILILAADNDSTLKISEYIKAGKPILALNNQVSYILEHKKTAYLTNDLNKGLNELIKNKKLREKISQNLKKQKVYTWKEVSEMYLNEIKKFLRENEK